MRAFATGMMAVLLSASAAGLDVAIPAAAGRADVVATSAAAPDARALVAPRYRLVNLGVLPGDELSIPLGISASGEVVGRSGGFTEPPRPFRWSGSTGLEPLSLPAGVLSGIATDVNSRGDVTGTVVLADHRDLAVRWTPTGRLIRLGAFGPSANSMGNAINDSVVVTGWSDADPNAFEGQEAFIKRPGSPITSITPGSRPGFGFDINRTGQVSASVEFDAVRWTNGRIRNVSGSLEGITEGTAINNSGQLAITQTNPDENSAWRWTEGAGVESLGLDPSDEPTTANGINSAGDIVGRGDVPGAPVMGGYLFTDAVGLLYLSDLLLPRYGDWYISEAWDVNDAGQIVAEGLNLKTGRTRAVLLSPI